MKRIVFMIIIASLLIITACDIKKPVIPSWDVNFKVPLMNKNYYAGDLVDGTNFGVDDESLMFFYTEGEIQGAIVEEGDLKISANEEGTGFIPIITGNDYDIFLPLKDPDEENDVDVVTAQIRDGFLSIEFEDTDLSNNPTITIIFAELFDPNGQQFNYTFSSSQLNGTHDFSLAGYVIEQEGGEQVLDNLAINILYETDLDPNTPDDMLLTNVKISYNQPLYFYEIRGLVNNLSIYAENFFTEIEVDYPDNIENAIHLNSPEVKFDIWSQLGFDAKFTAKLKAVNTRSGEERIVELDPRIINGIDSPGDSTLTKLVFQNSIETLMEIAPDYFELVDALFTLLNPENSVGFASEGLGYFGEYIASVPFDISFTADEAIRPKELIDIAISKSNRDQIKDNAKSVSFVVKFKNEFTAGAAVNLYLANTDDKEILYGDLISNDPRVQRITFEDNFVYSGAQDEPYYAELDFSLSDDDLKLFSENETIYFGMEFFFEEGNTLMHSYDKINIVSNLDIKLRINGDGEEE
ncbi:MAG: hypothetical protein PHF36_09230 [Candidatus Cloacimonetes bacterium]|nr:hypothetical protein [Candidatus Cloacimonadota bacterium]